MDLERIAVLGVTRKEMKHSRREEKHSMREEKHSMMDEKHSRREEMHSRRDEKHSRREIKLSLHGANCRGSPGISPTPHQYGCSRTPLRRTHTC